MSRINGIPLKEDKALIAKVEEQANRCFERSITQFTDFLDMRQLDVAKGALKQFGLSQLKSYGGFENAERTVLCISQNDDISFDDFPVCCIKVEYNSHKKLTHRDFLGAILSLGIKREKIGDISVSDNCAYIAAAKIISVALMNELSTVGSCAVSCELCDSFPSSVKADLSSIRASVSSLRLDSVVSAAIKQSRQNTQNIIRRCGVKLNCREIFAPDAKVFENDIFSIKGYGKFVLSEVLGQSKKGKTIIIINKYN